MAAITGSVMPRPPALPVLSSTVSDLEGISPRLSPNNTTNINNSSGNNHNAEQSSFPLLPSSMPCNSMLPQNLFNSPLPLPPSLMMPPPPTSMSQSSASSNQMSPSQLPFFNPQAMQSLMHGEGSGINLGSMGSQESSVRNFLNHLAASSSLFSPPSGFPNLMVPPPPQLVQGLNPSASHS